MKRIHLPILFLLFSVIEVQVQAADKEAVIIEVRKTIPMTKAEKVFKHYFINGGENLGLKKGSTIDVLRRIPFHDPIKNVSVGDIRVKVGEIEIIHSEATLSVARQTTLENPETRPVLDYEAVMVGDRLDLGTIRDAKKVALLKAPNEAKQLIKEGERNLRMLASVSTNDSKPVVSKKQKSQKKSVSQKKK
jgi:hypothetical protein